MYNYFFIQLDVVLFYNNFITSKNIEFINAYRIVESESLFNLTRVIIKVEYIVNWITFQFFSFESIKENKSINLKNKLSLIF